MKALYISASPKKQEDSASKTAAAKFIEKWREQNPGAEIEELDLYNEDIPLMNERHVMGRATLSEGQDFQKLSPEEQQQTKRIDELGDQFLSADRYIIAAPMWSIFFPAILKQYIDCIIINGKTILITDDKVEGLLGDKERKMVYIQSSGGIYPKILGSKVNHGEAYLKDTFKFLGVEKFESILVEGVDMKDVGFGEAMEHVEREMDKIAKHF